MAERLMFKDGYKHEVKTSELIARYLKGETMCAISKDTGINVPTIRYRLRKSGIDTSRRVEGGESVANMILALKGIYDTLSDEEKTQFRDEATRVFDLDGAECAQA